MSNEAHRQDTKPDQEQAEDTVQPAQAQDDAQKQQTYRQVAASHIGTLNEINRQLPKMLTWFATALTQLTNHPIHDADHQGAPDTLEARQATFRKYAMYVGMITEEIRDELTKQINDLELHKVIPKSHRNKYAPAKRKGDREGLVTDTEGTVKNGGYGEFDVGVLNARASSGLVGGEHVLDRVKAMLEELERRSEGHANGEKMIVDG